MLRKCPNCRREFLATVKGEYCAPCWGAWTRNDGSFEKRTVPMSKLIAEAAEEARAAYQRAARKRQRRA